MVWLTGDFKGSLRLHGSSAYIDTRLIVADFEQNRYLRKLDQELHKFQLELEADNRGITEVHHKLVFSLI